MASESQAADVRFSVLTFNVHNGSPPPGMSTTNIIKDQVQGIESILKKTKNIPNLLIHVQDNIPGKKRNKFKTTLELTDADFTIASEGTAAIFLDNRTHTKCKGHFLHADDLPPHEHLTDRLCAFKFDAGGTGRKWVLMVSYHGRNNDITLEEKKHCLKTLITWVESRCTSRQYYGAVVAGDFNLTMAEAKTILPEPNLLFVPDDPSFRTSIDFAIVFRPDNIKVARPPKVLKIARGYDEHESVEGYNKVTKVDVKWRRKCTVVQPFDHPRVLFHFKLVSEVDKVTKDMAKLSLRKKKGK